LFDFLSVLFLLFVFFFKYVFLEVSMNLKNNFKLKGWLIDWLVFNATFNNISVISWRLVLLVEETVKTRRKPPTCRKSLTNFFTIREERKRMQIMSYASIAHKSIKQLDVAVQRMNFVNLHKFVLNNLLVSNTIYTTSNYYIDIPICF